MPKIAFLFPGQGARRSAWPSNSATAYPPPRQLFDEPPPFSATTCSMSAPTARPRSSTAPPSASRRSIVASLAALESLRHRSRMREAECVATAGLSLGEYTALVFAGALRFADGLRLVQQRGEAMQAAADATPSGMVSVLGLDWRRSRSCAQGALGRHDADRQSCSARATSSSRARKPPATRSRSWRRKWAAMKTIRLAVAGAFHTDIMKPADREAGRRPARSDAAAGADAGLVERGRQAAHRSRRDSRLARASGAAAGAMGSRRCAACSQAA